MVSAGDQLELALRYLVGSNFETGGRLEAACKVAMSQDSFSLSTVRRALTAETSYPAVSRGVTAAFFTIQNHCRAHSIGSPDPNCPIEWAVRRAHLSLQ